MYSFYKLKECKKWTINTINNGLPYLHREYLPALEYENGDKEWWYLGDRFRQFKLPTVEYENGTKEWHHSVTGSLHKYDGPAVEYSNGDKEWWIKGKRHRHDGPAVTYGNKKFWFINGELIKCTF